MSGAVSNLWVSVGLFMSWASFYQQMSTFAASVSRSQFEGGLGAARFSGAAQVASMAGAFSWLTASNSISGWTFDATDSVFRGNQIRSAQCAGGRRP